MGDILYRAAHIYRRHFLHVLVIVFPPYILLHPFDVWLTLRARDQGPEAFVLWMTFRVLAFVLISFVSLGALSRSISEWHQGGAPRVWTSYDAALRRGLPLVWAYFLSFPVWVGLLAVGTALASWGSPFRYFGKFIASVLPFAWLILVPRVIILENVQGSAALKRSWGILRRNVLRAVLILFFWTACYGVVSFLLNFVSSVLPKWGPGPANASLKIVFEQLAQIISFPFVAIPFNLLYYDSRPARGASA